MTARDHVAPSPREPQPPLFVFGAARSGTTLTYSLLLSSGCFPIYEAESRILECASRYGHLRSSRNRRAFLADFLRSRQFARSGLSEETVRELAARRSASYVDFLDGFMAELCHAQGKRRWVEKSPNNMQFLDELASYYPDAKFIHVVRDGRSVTVSQRRHGGAKYSADPRRQLIWIANVWAQQVSAGRRGASLGRERYLELRYEDVVTDLPAALARLAEFAGVHLDEAAVEQSDVGALGTPNTAFDMSDAKVSAHALERWRTILTEDEIALLDWQVGDQLGAFGYAVEPVDAGSIPLRDRALARASRLLLDLRHALNVRTPVGRFARRPLEIGLS